MRANRPYRSAAFGLALTLRALPLAAETGPEVLAKARQAHGGDAWDRVGTLASTGSFFLDGDGRPVPGEILEDLPNGRYRRSQGAGGARSCWSYDGTRFWYRIGDGVPFTVEGPLRDQVARACAFMHARGFWFPHRFPAPVEYLGLAGEDGGPCHVLRMTPAGALPVEVRVDAGSWLIRRIAWPMARGLWCYTFSEYRTVQGLVLPFRICTGWEKAGCQTLIQIDGYAQEETRPPWEYQCREREPAEAGPCP